MSFLSPWFLLAGLAVGIPIWVHLVRREQPNRVPFSSLMFFRRLPVKSVSRQRLKHLLLLAIRIAVILLIALAFARPYFPNMARTFSGGRNKHVAILLDTSLSMQYGDRWQRALAAAKDAIAGLSERDRAQIITFSSEYEIRNMPSSDKSELRAILDGGLSPGAGPTSFTQAFRAVEKISEDLNRPVSVVLISDMQRAGTGGQPQRLSGAIAEFKAVDLAGQNASNWTVSQARSHRTIYRARYPDRLVAEVRGYNTPTASKEAVLTIGNKVVQRKMVEVPASGTATVVFDTFDVPLGNNPTEISITPHDSLPQDDSFRFVLERREPYRLLFLHVPGETAELYYFRSALGAETDSPFSIDARTPGDAASLRLQDYATVVLSNVGDPPASIRSALRNFVSGGRGLLITMGSRFPAPALETELKEIWPAKATEKRLLTPDRERMILLGQFDKEHPLFREFRDPGAADSLRSSETYAYIRLQPQGNVLLRYANGDPALVEKQVGRGRVLQFASIFDNVWNDFPLHPAFIPLLHQLVRYTSQLSEEPPAYTIPSAVSLSTYKAASQAGVWDVIGPDGKRQVSLEHEARPDFLTLRQAGFYELRQSDGSRLIAANIDPRESDLTALTAEDRALWTANPTEQQDAAAAPGPDAARRQNVWWALLLIALLLGMFEVYLANQYLRPQLESGVPLAGTAEPVEAKESAYGR
ncbi:MAG: BatA domain-containing protein [Acidobacteria bacterium]|nr:BatA domain-containing protein [Acidobacteriota bacterium]